MVVKDGQPGCLGFPACRSRKIRLTLCTTAVAVHRKSSKTSRLEEQRQGEKDGHACFEATRRLEGRSSKNYGLHPWYDASSS